VPSREPWVPPRPDCGCDGPVCSRCFLCPVHCHCQLREVDPKSDLERNGVPKTLPRERSQTTDLVSPGKPNCDSPISSASGEIGPRK
jgi:hypothetical protein